MRQQDSFLGEPAKLGQLGWGGILILAYLAITRIGALQAAKIGVEIGPVPIFLTEIFILGMVVTVVFSRASLFFAWLCTGGMASWPGLLLWLLFMTSLVQCVVAYNGWGIMAIRDLAIFGYAVVFPLTYLILDTQEKAAAAMRCFAYSGLILAIALIFDVNSGLHVLFPVEFRGVEGVGDVVSYGGGDIGGTIAFSGAALLAYAASTAERRFFHLAAGGACVYAVMIGQTRSAEIGLILAGLYLFLCMRAIVRLWLILGVLAGIGLMAAILILSPESGIGAVINGFWLTLQSAGQGARDGNAYFRLLRWNAVYDVWRGHPLFGVGFGRPLIPNALLEPYEIGLNAGLPHNTFLTIMARLGLFGLVLVMLPWLGSAIAALTLFRRSRFQADLCAAGATLFAMMGYAFFVLFIERPLHAAALWITVAMVTRMAEPPKPKWAAWRNPMLRARYIARDKGFI